MIWRWAIVQACALVTHAKAHASAAQKCVLAILRVEDFAQGRDGLSQKKIARRVCVWVSGRTTLQGFAKWQGKKCISTIHCLTLTLTTATHALKKVVPENNVCEIRTPFLCASGTWRTTNKEIASLPPERKKDRPSVPVSYIACFGNGNANAWRIGKGAFH